MFQQATSPTIEENHCLMSLENNSMSVSTSINSPLSIVFSSSISGYSLESSKNNYLTSSENELTPNSNVQFIYFTDSSNLTNPSSLSYNSAGIKLNFISKSVSALTTKPLQIMDTLKPPGYYLPVETVQSNEQSDEKNFQNTGNLDVIASEISLNSPPRSRSIDLSALRRDIEFFNVNSSKTDVDYKNNLLNDIKNNLKSKDYVIDNIYIDSIKPSLKISTDSTSLIIVTKQNRSRSHDPTESADHVLLRRPSRIEHLSEIFRYFKENKKQFVYGIICLKM